MIILIVGVVASLNHIRPHMVNFGAFTHTRMTVFLLAFGEYFSGLAPAGFSVSVFEGVGSEQDFLTANTSTLHPCNFATKDTSHVFDYGQKTKCGSNKLYSIVGLRHVCMYYI
jgi:hypothetical protein